MRDNAQNTLDEMNNKRVEAKEQLKTKTFY